MLVITGHTILFAVKAIPVANIMIQNLDKFLPNSLAVK